MTAPTEALASGRWARAERLRLSGMVGVIAGIHVVGWSLYLYYTSNLGAALTWRLGGFERRYGKAAR